MRTATRMPSSCMFFFSACGTRNPPSSVSVAPAPVPNSTRPSLSKIERGDALGDTGGVIDVRGCLHDAVTDANVLGALAHGGEKYFGRRGVRVFFEKMMLGGPDVIVSALVGQYGLFERILKQRVFGIAGPRPRELVFVETAKFHGS